MTVTKLVGNPANNPELTPNNPADWTRSGDQWTGTTPCPINAKTSFAARLSDDNGQGPDCRASVDVAPETPTCELTSTRINYSETCKLTVTRKSGTVAGLPVATPSNPTNWTQNGDRYTGTTSCELYGYNTFSVYLSGPAGSGPSCISPSVLPVPKEIPFCELSVSRQGLTNICKLTVKLTGGTSYYPPPVASPRNPTDWKQLQSPNSVTFEGTLGCAVNWSHQFSAYIPTAFNVAGRVCEAAPVEKIPAPSCEVSVVRQQTTDQCSYSLRATSPLGTIASYSIGTTGTKAAWTGAAPATGKFTCSQVANTPLNMAVWGVGGTPQTGSCNTIAPKIAPPTCNFSAKRRSRTAICDLTIAGGGVIDTAKSPQISPSATGRWNGLNWSGTASCPTTKATMFTAKLAGPGGSVANCTNVTVSKL